MTWNKTTITLAIIAVILACISGWTAYSLKQKTEEAASYQAQTADLAAENMKLNETIGLLKQEKHSTKRVYVDRIPVTVVNNEVIYRDIYQEGSSEDEITLAVETVLATMRENMDQSVTSSAATIVKTETITRRQTVGVGLGYGSGGNLWGIVTGRVVGPLSVWGASDSDIAVMGGMLSF